MTDHEKEVKNIAATVSGFYDRKETFRIYHGSTNSTRKSALGRDPKKVVDTSRLNHVVHVDTENRTALVEPNVPMDRLIEETLKYDLIPPIVMEFPGITVGGGYNGTAGESSSFKHGFFDQTLNWVEMVLANGEVITASDDNEYSDLFRGAAGAVGSFGVTTMVELQLTQAKKYIETTYHPVTSTQQAVSLLHTLTSRPDSYDYIDGILFSPTSGAIITGRMTNKPSHPVQRFSDPSDPWFYLHVQSIGSDRPNLPTTECIPLPDYLFRYDRGGFWVGREAFSYFPLVPFNASTLWFLDDFLHTRMLYRALHAAGKNEHMIIQDLALPYANAVDFMQSMDEMLGIWPLWLCPLKQGQGKKTMHPHLNQYEEDGTTLKPMLNIGFWGRAPQGHDNFVLANRAIEKLLKEARGMKWLYAQSYSPEDEFWEDFNKQWYDDLRRKYHAETLPDVFQKVRVDVEAEKMTRQNAGMLERVTAMWPFSGIYGIAAAISSGDYLPRRPAWRDWVSES